MAFLLRHVEGGTETLSCLASPGVAHLQGSEVDRDPGLTQGSPVGEGSALHGTPSGAGVAGGEAAAAPLPWAGPNVARPGPFHADLAHATALSRAGSHVLSLAPMGLPPATFLSPQPPWPSTCPGQGPGVQSPWTTALWSSQWEAHHSSLVWRINSVFSRYSSGRADAQGGLERRMGL